MKYLATMTEDQRVVFLKVLTKLAMSDGEYDDNEKRFVKELSEVLGVSEKRFEEVNINVSEKDLIEEVKIIKDRKIAMELIKEMCLLANSNGDLSDKEILLIGHVGEALGLELEKIEQISRWVVDRIIWLEEGKIIFEKV